MTVPHHRRGLRARLLLWLMASATVVLGTGGVVDWFLQSQRIRDERDRATEGTLDRLALMLPAAIEDLDTEAMRNAVASELINPHVAALSVEVGGRVLATQQRAGETSTGREIRRRFGPPGDAAEVVLRIDPRPLAEAQVAVVVQTSIAVVLMNLLIAVAVSFVVARLTRPVTALTLAVEAIAAGDLDAPLPGGEGADEVAVLTRSFASMRDAVRRQLADIAAQNRDLDRRVEERTRELERLHQDLLLTAQQAGRAEIATSVLHNIGNVLTGAFIDLEGLRRENGTELAKRAAQLAELLKNQQDLAQFIAEDRNGRDLPRFLALFLEELLAADQRDGIRTQRLSAALGLVRDTLAVQQSYANTRPIVQALDLAHEVEQMMLLHATTLEKHGIRVVRHYVAVPRIDADRSKLGHIIANLLKNAVEALDQVPMETRSLHLHVRQGPHDTIELAIQDSGAGIDQDIRERLFGYGFTTKTAGHGFGLHWCANAMKEMGGTIRADSPGPAQGATFTLIFPRAGVR